MKQVKQRKRFLVEVPVYVVAEYEDVIDDDGQHYDFDNIQVVSVGAPDMADVEDRLRDEMCTFRGVNVDEPKAGDPLTADGVVIGELTTKGALIFAIIDALDEAGETEGPNLTDKTEDELRAVLLDARRRAEAWKALRE